MAKISDILKSGALGLGTAVLAKNPKMLQGFGVAGNLAYDAIKDKEKEKEEEERLRREAEAEAAAQTALAIGKPRMKKGGKVSSASKRADGIAIRGKTRA